MSKNAIRMYTVYFIILFFIPFFFLKAEKISSIPIQSCYKKPIKLHDKGETIIGLRLLKKLWFPQECEWPKKFFHTNVGLVENDHQDNLRVYFINHATNLIQINGYNILTDPVWAKTIGPYNIGLKRITNPGIEIKDLPKIDYIIISHNHYDHLDLYTLKILKKKYPDITIIVPNKVEKLLIACGFKKKQLISMMWNQKVTLHCPNEGACNARNTKNLDITCTPAKHFSGRGLFDKNKTLWAGYILSSGGYNVYFAGDTGFSQEMFEKISYIAPKLHVCLLPIGAYEPRNLLAKVHINPEEAVKVHKMLKSCKSVPIHYGTFRLSIEKFTQPLQDLKEALKTHGCMKDEFAILNHGAFLDCVDNFNLPKEVPIYKTGFVKK
jgi:L-ascorbate metabolism protein UlaG (beta-lactamase superfamily)